MVLTIRVLLTIVTLLFYYVIRPSVVLRNKYFRHDIFCVPTNKYIMYKVQDYDFAGVLYNNAAHPVVHVCESRNVIYMGNIHDRIISLRRKVLVYTTIVSTHTFILRCTVMYM